MTDDPKKRAERNREIVRRMQAGDNLCHTDLNAYRWQPRPIIKKDARAIMALQGTEPLEVETLPVLLLTRDE